MLLFQLTQQPREVVEVSPQEAQIAADRVAGIFRATRVCLERAFNVANQEVGVGTHTRPTAISSDYLLETALGEARRIRDRNLREQVEQAVRDSVPQLNIGIGVEAFKIRVLGGYYQSEFGAQVPEEGTIARNERAAMDLIRRGVINGQIDFSSDSNSLVRSVMKGGGHTREAVSIHDAQINPIHRHNRHDRYERFIRELQDIPETQMFKIGEDRGSMTNFALDLQEAVQDYNQRNPNHRISQRVVGRALRAIREMITYGEAVEVAMTSDMNGLREILPEVLRNTRLGMFEEREGTHDFLVFSPRWRADFQERTTTGSPLGVDISEPRVRELAERMEQLYSVGLVGDAQIDAVRRAQVALGLHREGRVITETQVNEARRIIGLN